MPPLEIGDCIIRVRKKTSNSTSGKDEIQRNVRMRLDGDSFRGRTDLFIFPSNPKKHDVELPTCPRRQTEQIKITRHFQLVRLVPTWTVGFASLVRRCHWPCIPKWSMAKFRGDAMRKGACGETTRDITGTDGRRKECLRNLLLGISRPCINKQITWQ